MARDREAAQDIALYHMEKLNRNNKDVIREKSLAEQLDELKQPSSERRKKLPSHEWYKDIRDIITQEKKCRVSANLWNWVTAKYKDEIEKMRTSGSDYNEVLAFARTKEEEFINR